MTTLHFIPRPLPEESPFSLLRRTVEENGYKNCRTFVTSRISENFSILNPMLQNSEFAELLCEHAEEFSSEIIDAFYPLTISTNHGLRISINNIAINPRLVRHSTSAMCTDCIKEGWEKQIKDLLPAENCPYHSKKYITSCPNCHRRLVWNDQPVIACKCKTPLISPICSDSDVVIENKLLFLLRSQSQVRFDLFSSILFGLRWGEPNQSHKDRRAIVGIALAICLGESEEASKLLIDLYSLTPPLNKSFIIAKLSPFTPKAIVSQINTALIQIDSSEQCFDQVPGPLSGRQLFVYLHLTTGVWKRIQTHKNFPQKAKNALFTPKEIKTITRIHRNYCERELNLREESSPHKALTPTEAAQHLKVAEHVLREIILANMLGEPIKTHGKPYRLLLSKLESFKKKHIALQQIADALNRSVMRIRKSIAQLNIETYPLPHGSRYTIVIARSDLNKIRHHGNNTKNPCRLHKRLSVALPAANAENLSDFYTTNETKQYLGLDRTVVCQLVRCRILQSTCTGRRGTYLINKNDVHDFKNKYMLVTEAAKLLQTPYNQTTDILLNHGVSPCTGPHIDGEHITLFLRSDITDELKMRIAPTHSTFGRFRAEHLLTATSEAAKLLGLSRHTFVQLRIKIISPIRPSYYQSRTHVSPEEVEIIKDYLQQYEPTPPVLEATWLSRRQFNEFFILNGLISEIVINGVPHIKKEDTQKLINFSNNYCTCRVADSLLNAPRGHTKFSVFTKRLELTPPPSDIKITQNLLNRKQIESMTYVPLRRHRKKNQS